MVAAKLEEELERRREEIEDEVERRVLAAKLEMEVDILLTDKRSHELSTMKPMLDKPRS